MEPRMLYGVTIHDSIKKGDKAEMQSLLSEAQRQHSELGQAIQDLQKASGGWSPIRPLYGVTISDAIRRNNASELQTLLSEARQVHSQQGDLGKAIRDLESALGK